MSDLRRIGELHLPNLVPADLTDRPLPMLEWLDVDELWVDPAYQRDLTPKARRLVAQLVEGWDWLKCAPLLVAMTERGFEVYDGQSRATAGRLHPQITALPAYVLDGSTLPQRAGAFVSHARDRIAVSAGQIWHAAVAAGDAEALTIRDACAAVGLVVLPTTPEGAVFRPRQTMAIATLRKIVSERGAARARVVFGAVAEADLAPVAADHIKAADLLLFGADYAGELDAATVTAMLRGVSVTTNTEVQALAVAKHLPRWRALAAVLYRNRDKRRTRAAEPVPDRVADAVPSRPVARPAIKPKRYSPPPTPPVTPRHRADVTSSICGDPPPGRSALDQRKAR